MFNKHDLSFSELKKFQNHLMLFGDLMVKNGQNNLQDALNDLPFEPESMQEWCDKWLTVEGRKKMFRFIDID